jgi:hypothetical protein
LIEGDCGMCGRVIGFFALAALIAVPSATAQIVLASTVFRAVDLPSGTTTAVRVTCAPGFLAVSGGVHVPAPGVATLAVRPTGFRAYAFRFGNPTSTAARVTVAVACRKIPALRAETPFLRLTLAKSRPMSVAPGAEKTVTLACPPGTLPGGSGFDVDSGRLSVRRQTQTLRAFSLSVRNLGTATGFADLYGNCLTLVRPPGSVKQRLHVSVLTATTPIRPGAQVLTQRCKRGWFSLSTGYALPAGLRLGGSAAVTGGGRWTLTSAAAARTLADLQLVCGRLAPG